MQNLFSGSVFVHPSVYRQSAGLLRQVPAELRPGGAVRYRCPVTGSFILVTDPDALRRLERPLARLHCVGCREMHFFACTDADEDNSPVVVPPASKS